MSRFNELTLVKMANDLYDRGVPRDEIKSAIINAPAEAILEWFEHDSASAFLSQVDQRRRSSRSSRPESYQRPVSYDEDGLQKPLVDTLAESEPVPPVVNSEGETRPSKITQQYAEAAAIRWVKTTPWEGRYLWDALTDIDWALTKIDKGRRRAESSFKTSMGNLDLVEEAIIEVKGGSTPEEAAEIIFEGWQGNE